MVGFVERVIFLYLYSGIHMCSGAHLGLEYRQSDIRRFDEWVEAAYCTHDVLDSEGEGVTGLAAMFDEGTG